MKRHALALVLTGVLGSMVVVGNAEACHKKKCACTAPAPVCVVEPAPCPAPPPAPVCEPACAPKKKCGLFSHMKMPKFGGLCHKKAACEPAPACYETVAYAAPAPVYATTQAPVYSSGQASAQH
ncbi:hypothetical protein OJF2_43690 [Aquisphaera giovannonii]|uniref:Uncharacterized protein n=1 Tax=Aquisphaera giovannonii TaxID=406548 RepID=A0A5B9W5B2_9BACT|nr:hypothetical protein [Aquisphaera giovannonii]QEH35812.1 hypothetical protein OJF2_43690 [Aquisphaera giovannonii]